jgi:UDP-N-acetylmuramyl pentapeptide phosphotransferase/UDP-N-acetylglucosamine-1-phosphate transferase
MENYFLISIILIICSYLYLKIAVKFKIIDKPNYRSSHTKPTIRGGGILFLISLLLFYYLSGFEYTYFVFGTLLIGVVSFIDDLKTLSSLIRLPFQFIAIFFILYQFDLDLISLYFLPVILLLGVGFINVYNFMDGINGITGLYSISIFIGFYLINNDIHVINQDLIIFLVLSLLVFGYFNFRKKARFFAGDIGSITIAMCVFFIGFVLVKETSSPLILFSVVVYGTDAIYTMLYRLRIKEKLSEAHRHHIYQKLVHILKIPHLKVSSYYAIIQLLVNIIIYYSYNASLETQYLIILFFSISFTVLYFYIFKLIERKFTN